MNFMFVGYLSYHDFVVMVTKVAILNLLLSIKNLGFDYL